MLRKELLNYSVRDGALIPRFLTSQDLPWLRSLIDEAERFNGRREAELGDRLLVPLGNGVDSRKQRLAAEVIRRMVGTRERGVDSRQARARLFAAAAVPDAQAAAVLQSVAEEFGVSAEVLLDSLFGDLPGERIVVMPDGMSPEDVALRANLALARGFLERASAVSIAIEGNARAIVRQAKLRRLICGARSRGDDAVVLEISGPFALFRHTQIYGRALGELVPLLAWCRRFRLEATCVLGERSLTLRLASGDPIFPSAAPRRFDSKVEERFFRDVSRAGREWDVIREPEPVCAGPWLLFPDFALKHRHRPEIRWCVEIVGFWTERYLERKLAAYRLASIDKLILCVASDLACTDADFPAGAHVIRYKRTVDARAVLNVLEQSAEAAQVGQ